MNSRNFADALKQILELLMPVSGNGVMVLLPILQVVLFLIGLVRLFRPVDRKHGWITIANSLLYLLGIFLIENGRMPIPILVVFAIAAIVLGALNLSEKLSYTKKEILLALGIYGLLLAALVVIQIYVSKQSVAAYFSGISLLQWGYIVLFSCMGIRHLDVGIMLFLLMGGGLLMFSPSSDNEDITAWATGEEESVDTVSMSD